jgi:uncharacterized Fe-S center protein
VFASTDPVTIEQVCQDLVEKNKGRKIFKRGKFANGIWGKEQEQEKTIDKIDF